METALIEYLSSFLTSKRKALFDKVLENRTRQIAVVLEDINQEQNASAVLRTCDCLGIHDLFVAENRNRFKIDREVALGASKWLNIEYFHPDKKAAAKEPDTLYPQDYHSLRCIQKLRESGYQIAVTTPNIDGLPPEKVDLQSGKIAVVFGSEVAGISDTFIKEADIRIRIPMYGFTESYNISVSAAIILYQLSQNLRKGNHKWHLTPQEKQEIKLEWLRKNLKSARELEEKFNSLNENPNGQ